MPWVNEKDFKYLPVLDQITVRQILSGRRRQIIRPLIRKEGDGTYSVNTGENLTNKSIGDKNAIFR